MASYLYHTRRFIGEELILAISDFSWNSPILITMKTCPYSHEETREERCGSSNCQYKSCQLFLTNKFANIILANKSSCMVLCHTCIKNLWIFHDSGMVIASCRQNYFWVHARNPRILTTLLEHIWLSLQAINLYISIKQVFISCRWYYCSYRYFCQYGRKLLWHFKERYNKPVAKCL